VALHGGHRLVVLVERLQLLVELVAEQAVGDIGRTPADELGECRLFFVRGLAAVLFELLE